MDGLRQYSSSAANPERMVSSYPPLLVAAKKKVNNESQGPAWHGSYNCRGERGGTKGLGRQRAAVLHHTKSAIPNFQISELPGVCRRGPGRRLGCHGCVAWSRRTPGHRGHGCGVLSLRLDSWSVGPPQLLHTPRKGGYISAGPTAVGVDTGAESHHPSHVHNDHVTPRGPAENFRYTCPLRLFQRILAPAAVL
jgi:hypothetical protein